MKMLRKSRILEEMKREMRGQPQEIAMNPLEGKLQSEKQDKMEKYEEELFQRLPISKADKKQERIKIRKLQNTIENYDDIKALINLTEDQKKTKTAEIESNLNKYNLHTQIEQIKRSSHNNKETGIGEKKKQKLLRKRDNKLTQLSKLKKRMHKH
jgi:hypothetical protein